jgi:hypothetical protein
MNISQRWFVKPMTRRRAAFARWRAALESGFRAGLKQYRKRMTELAKVIVDPKFDAQMAALEDAKDRERLALVPPKDAA